MGVTFRLSGAIKKCADNKDAVTVTGDTVDDCIADLDKLFPGVRSLLVDTDNNLKAVLIFLNGDNITSMDGLRTAVQDNDELGVIPLVAGG